MLVLTLGVLGQVGLVSPGGLGGLGLASLSGLGLAGGPRVLSS